MPSRADGLRWGDYGANVCPPNYFRITTVESCQAVARVAGVTFTRSQVADYAPKGCYAWDYARR